MRLEPHFVIRKKWISRTGQPLDTYTIKHSVSMLPQRLGRLMLSAPVSLFTRNQTSRRLRTADSREQPRTQPQAARSQCVLWLQTWCHCHSCETNRINKSFILKMRHSKKSLPRYCWHIEVANKTQSLKWVGHPQVDPGTSNIWLLSHLLQVSRFSPPLTDGQLIMLCTSSWTGKLALCRSIIKNSNCPLLHSL